jgi:para-aminobenzoate synthetase / 4-amino-4-deoxychorismate lyase
VTLGIPKDAYPAAIAKIKEHLAAGDTYQVNFTDRLAFDSPLSPAELFYTLATQQRVAYSAFLSIEGRPIIFLSPELFFKTDGDRITTRPMKGTMPRDLDLADDDRIASLLCNDEKHRSEHVMIVDLLRNDLGPISRAGTIQVQNAFSIERYDTLHQMTSTVVGSLKPKISFYDIFEGLFPSGSITGAPKHRTMQIIQKLERNSRGVYTGAIGFIHPNRSATFNVATRTLTIQGGEVTMRVGGGILADSDAEDKYRECLLKAACVTRESQPFHLTETMLWEGEVKLLDLHLARLQSSAPYFEFRFDQSRILSTSADLTKSPAFASGASQRIRLTLAASGRVATEVSPAVTPQSNLKIWLTTERTSSTDRFQRHKTTRRDLYDRFYKVARNHGFEEVIFANEKGEISEGSISNIFIQKKENS